MEMDNSAIQQMLQTQTQLMQQMQTMLSQQSMQNTGGASLISSPMVPIGGVPYAPGAPAASGLGVPSPYVPGMGTYPATANVFGGGLMGQMLNNVWNYNPTRMSKEGQAEYMAQQNRTLTEGALNSANTAINGAATVGSFMIPGGLIASMAAGTVVGGAVAAGTSMVIDGARKAMDYEDILRRKGYLALNPYESNAESGGIGFSRPQTQDLAQFLRHAGPDNSLGDNDIQSILNGALDNKLLKSTTDVESFKKKFSSLIESVKKITVTMDQSIDEAMSFMGDMNMRGISDKEMPMMAAQFKTTSSMMGVSATQGANMILQTTDAITQGTGINAGVVAQTTSKNMFVSSLLSDQSRDTDPAMYQYIQNLGGPGAAGAMTEQNLRGYISSKGSNMFLGLLASGFDSSDQNSSEFVINESRMRDLLSGKHSLGDMTSRATASIGKLSSTQQFALQDQAATLFQNFANGTEQYQLIDVLRQKIMETSNVDPISALRVMGVAKDREQAKMMDEQIKLASNPMVQGSMDAMKIKEALDATAISESPSIPQRIKYGWARMRADVGDAGQAMSDGFSNVFNDLQQWSTGMDDRSRVLGGRNYDLTKEGIGKEFSVQNFQTINDGLDAMQKVYDANRNSLERSTERFGGHEAPFTSGTGTQFADAKIDINAIQKTVDASNTAITNGQFDVWVSDLDNGRLNPADVSKLNDRLKDNNLTLAERGRIQYIVNKATGKYDGVRGNISQFLDWGKEKINMWPEWFNTKAKEIQNDVSGAFDNSTLTMNLLDKADKEFESQYKTADQQLTKIMTDGTALGTTKVEELQAAVRAGDASKVQELTNKQADPRMMDLTKRFNGLLDADSKAAAAGKTFKGMQQSLEAEAKSMQNIDDWFVNNKVMSKKDANKYFGGLDDEASTILKKMKKGDLSAEDMKAEADKLTGQLSSTFSGMAGSKLDAFAVELANQYPELQKEDLFVQGSNRVDPNKLATATMRVAGMWQSDLQSTLKGEAKSADAAKNGDDVKMKETADGHAKTMYEMIRVWMDEMRMMREAISGRLPQPPNNTTSVSSR